MGASARRMPRNLLDAAAKEGRESWMETVPKNGEMLRRRWALERGEPYQPGGSTVWVAPARSDAYGDVVLKVAWRHDESVHEAAGLRAWDGDGTARVHAVEELNDTTVLLLETVLAGNIAGLAARGRAGHRHRRAAGDALAGTRPRRSLPVATGHV